MEEKPVSSKDELVKFLVSQDILNPKCENVNQVIYSLASTRDPLVEYACGRAILKVASVEQLIQRHHGQFHCVNQITCLVLRCQLSQIQSRIVASFLQTKEPSLCEIHCQCNFYRLLFTLTSYLDERYLKEVTFSLFNSQWEGKRCLVRSQLNLLHKFTQESKDLSFVQPLELTRLHHMSHKECNFIGENVSKMTCSRLFTLIHMNWIAKSNGHSKDSLINSWNRLRESIEEASSSESSSSKHWLVSLMLDDDTHLLNSAFLFSSILLKLFPTVKEDALKEIHQFISSFFDAIANDYHVLLDWLTDDEETAVLLLQFLLFYLKVDPSQREENVTRVLNELHKSLDLLTRSSVMPFDVRPLMRLFNDV